MTEKHKTAVQREPVTLLACLVMSARFHNVTASPQQVTHEDIHVRAELLLAAQKLDPKVSSAPRKPQCLQHFSLPAIAASEDGQFFIIAQLDSGKDLIRGPRAGGPEVNILDQLKARRSGELVPCRTHASLAAELTEFDFNWFVPAIIKYCNQLCQGLLVPFVLQILASPTLLSRSILRFICWKI